LHSILHNNLTVTSRSKLYLIFTLLSLTFFFYSVSQITYVTAAPSDTFGLASHFTPAYWIGLALLVLCSIVVFLDKEVESNFLNLFILINLGLYLFGIATLVQENVRHTTIYTNLADVRNLLATGHIDIVGPNALSYYRTWPGAHFLHAITLQVTGLDFKDWLKFAPFIWVISFIFSTYAIGRHFNLPRNSSFLLSLLALCSYWMFQSDLTQQGMAVLLLLPLFMLLVKPNPRSTVAVTVLVLLCYIGLVLTHGLTSLGLLLAVIVLSIYKKYRGEAISLTLLFSTIWLTWFVYQAIAALKMGVNKWMSAPWDYIFRMGTNIKGLYEPTHTGVSPLIAQYSQLAYIFIFGLLVIAVIIFLFMGRIKPESRPWLMMLVAWIVGLAISGFIFPNREMYTRLYILGLIPVLSIILIAFSNRKLLVPLILLCMLLFLPARYSTEGSYGQILNSELAGTKFFGQHAVDPAPWFFYRAGDQGVLPFYNPEVKIWPTRWFTSDMPIEAFDEASYVLASGHGGIRYEVISRWMQSVRGERATLVYLNNDFMIYESRLTVRQ